MHVFENGVLQASPLVTLPVQPGAVEGLTGLALDPDFSENNFIYIFLSNGVPFSSRVIRFTVNQGIATDNTIIIEDLPAGAHNGGALLFGSDDKLYISVGDAGLPDLTQQLDLFHGKILRINRDGSIPDDNPIAGSPVFSSGLRSPFGLALRTDDRIFISENGPECDDELNILSPLANYGWRNEQECGDSDPSFIQPLIRINPTVSPTGIHFYRGNLISGMNGDLLFGEFNTGIIKRLEINGQNVSVKDNLINGEFGPILGITENSLGEVFFSTTDAIYKITFGNS